MGSMTKTIHALHNIHMTLEPLFTKNLLVIDWVLRTQHIKTTVETCNVMQFYEFRNGFSRIISNEFFCLCFTIWSLIYLFGNGRTLLTWPNNSGKILVGFRMENVLILQTASKRSIDRKSKPSDVNKFQSWDANADFKRKSIKIIEEQITLLQILCRLFDL